MSAAPGSGQDQAETAPPAVDIKAMPRVLSRIVGLALRHPMLVVPAVGCALFSALASLALPRLFGQAVDDVHRLLVLGAGDAPDARAALLQAAILVIAATTARGLLNGLSGFLAETTSQKVAYSLRLRFFDQLQRLSASFHDRTHSGELITRGMLDLESTRGFIQGGMMQAVTLFLLLVSVTTMLFLTDARMAMIGLAFVPIAGFALTRMGLKLRVAWLRVQQSMSALTLTVEENLQGVRVVRALSGRAFETLKFDGAAGEVLRQTYKRLGLRLRATATMNLSFWGSMALLLWYGGHRVIDGEITVGRLTEFLACMMLLQAPMRQITLIVSAAARTTSSGARLFEILDLEPDIKDRPGAAPLRVEQGVVRFENVSFAYEPGKPALRDVSFEVGNGRTLGIIGAPGSGKSTIANLIPRFYDVASGRILIDGQDVRDVTLESLRREVGLVQQEAFLFDTSVVNNIAYADPDAEEDRILEAARAAQIHDFAAGLPEAYRTRVGERGVQLSGGQRQRMSIARGVTPGPRIVILDDSTAAIDAVTEARVRAGIARATRNRTTIIIAHRLSSLMHADEILVLDEGRIVERGGHAALLARGGVYASLYELQTRADAAAPDLSKVSA